MNRTYRSAAIAAALLVGSSFSLLCSAHAATIVLGSSGTNDVTFTSTGVSGNIGVAIAASSPTGIATWAADPAGTYSLGADSFTAGPYNSGVFPVGPNSESFSFSSPDGDALTGTIDWTSINDNSIVNTFVGILSVTSIAPGSDAAFKAAFASLVAEIDFTTNALN